ncbi:TPA: LamG domain-containing protein, partial [Vibrio harveyi]|nr:LamG domain-containing protein [Vibrio harveyi]
MRIIIILLIILFPFNIYATSFSYDELGRLKRISNFDNSEEVYFLSDASTNIREIKKSKNVTSPLKDIHASSFEIESKNHQNYSDFSVNWRLNGAPKDIFYELYIGENETPNLYLSSLNEPYFHGDLSNIKNPIYFQVKAYDALGNKVSSIIKRVQPLDSDGDGLADHIEDKICTSKVSQDTDGDGLSDFQEYIVDKQNYATNPCAFDSDHDGMSDRLEYELGSNPLVADANEDANNNGITNWQEYTFAQAREDAEAGIVVSSGDRELDLRGNKETMQLSYTPQAKQSMTLMSWVKFNQTNGITQRMGTYGGSNNNLFIGIDKDGDMYAGGGSGAISKDNITFSSGEWTHLALVRTENGAIDNYVVYVNGQLFDSFSGVFKVRNSYSAYNLFIGALNSYNGVQDHMDAVLDDVQLWSRALTKTEVQSYMLTPPLPGEQDLIGFYNFSRVRGQWVENVATGEFDAYLTDASTLKVADVLPDSDGDGLTDRQEMSLCTDLYVADSDGDGLSDGVEMGATTGKVIADPCSIDSDHDGMSDNWEYKAGSNPLVADANKTIELDGITYWEAYVLAQSKADTEAGISITTGDRELDLRANKNIMQLGYTPQMAESMTLMTWIKFSQVKGIIQRMGIDSGAFKRLFLGIDQDGDMYAGGGNNSISKEDITFAANDWVHLALVVEEGGSFDRYTVYVNGGVFDDFSGYSKGSPNTRNLIIGALNSDNGVQDHMDAVLDDVQLWSRALTKTEVQSYMLTPPLPGEQDLIGFYNFSRVRGQWVENVATGEFDAYLTDASTLKVADVLPDSDGDGLTDRQEMSLCTDLYVADSDGDGLSDGVEMGATTGKVIADPCSIDSDHDGMSDNWEYKAGSNPLVADANKTIELDGITYWEAYVLAQSKADTEAGISITTGDRELDLRANKNIMQLGYTPQMAES